MKGFLKEAGIVAGATLGAGIFALPYVFYQAGLVAGVFYLLGLSAFVITAHVLYWKVVAATKGEKGLLELTRLYFGKPGYYLGLLAIVGGLTLTLVVHLILGLKFLNLLFPSLSATSALFLFWFMGTLPLFFKERRILGAEILGMIFIAVIVLFIFFTATGVSRAETAAPGLKNLFLPFGVILFALAGWTAVEPVYREGARGRSGAPPVKSFIFGTLFAALLYLLFAQGILNSAGAITADTVSGLTNWPVFKIVLLGILGVFSLWVSYMPISLEIKNSLMREGINPRLSLAFVASVPLLLSLVGFGNFIEVIGIAGGVFLSLQYMLIILVAEKSLHHVGLRKFQLNFSLAVFALAILYEVYYFVVK